MKLRFVHYSLSCTKYCKWKS